MSTVTGASPIEIVPELWPIEICVPSRHCSTFIGFGTHSAMNPGQGYACDFNQLRIVNAQTG